MRRLTRGARLCALVLAVCTLSGRSAVLATTTAPRGEIRVVSVTGGPGLLTSAPLVVALLPRIEVASMQFNVTVVPIATAPALEAPLGFTNGLQPPQSGPSLIIKQGNDSLLIGWLLIEPPLSDEVQIGSVTVPIPDTANIGDSYRIEIRNPSATSDGITDLALGGVAGEIQVGCVGDCDGSGQVSVGELITAVHIALDDLPLVACPAVDPSGDEVVTVDELIVAVHNALNGCGILGASGE